jgi:hypothetical protein
MMTYEEWSEDGTALRDAVIAFCMEREIDPMRCVFMLGSVLVFITSQLPERTKTAQAVLKMLTNSFAAMEKIQ